MSTVAASIESKLTRALEPVYLQINNESHKHNVPSNSETHFQVIVVSDRFQSQSLVQRHREVNAVLKQELEGPVHALSIIAKTPQQWQNMQDQGVEVQPSPNCRGGDGSLPKRNESV